MGGSNSERDGVNSKVVHHLGQGKKHFNIHMNRATSYSYDEANISTTIA